MKVWIILYTEENADEESIVGIFDDEHMAKEKIAEYCLENDLDTSYLYLVEREVGVMNDWKSED